MNKYRLKKEARQFFKPDMALRISPMSFWEKETVHPALLDEVERVNVTYGKQTGMDSRTMSNWKSDDGDGKSVANFFFTVTLNDCTNEEYNDVNVAELMDKIQAAINKHFEQ